MKKRKDYGVDNENFARCWAKSESLLQFENLTGMPRQIASARANKLRKHGVRLKKMRRVQKNQLDVAHLNKIIEEVAREPKPARTTPQAVEKMLGKVEGRKP